MTAILGGGITGLSAAYYCLEQPKLGSIFLYEASNRLGGWIQSLTSPSGIIFEKGPRTVRPRGPAGTNTLELIDKLNLNEKVIPINSKHPAARNRLIYANKKLHLLPNSLSSFFKTQEPFKQPLIAAIWNDLKAAKVPKDDESIYSFVERRLGKDIANYLISPMICGICAGNAQQVSVNFLLESAFKFEQKHGSITKGLLIHLLKNFRNNNSEAKAKTVNKLILSEKAKAEKWSVWTLQGGLQQLPIALNNYLISKPNFKLNVEKRCEKITFKPAEVELTFDGKSEEYCRVISCLSSKNLAPLIQRQHPQLSRELGAIPHVTVAVVNLHYSGDVLPMEAFGFLVPPSENLPILGIIFDSCVVKQDSSTVLTVMMGGAWFEKYFGNSASQEHLLSVAVNQTKSILNIKDEPVEYDVAVLKDCIPQYIVGHNQRVQRIKDYISAHKIPLALCGSSYSGVGLNDVILSAKQTVSYIA